MGVVFLDTPAKMTPKPLVFRTERAGIHSSSKEKQKPPAGFCTSLFLFTIQTQLLLILGRDRPGSRHDRDLKNARKSLDLCPDPIPEVHPKGSALFSWEIPAGNAPRDLLGVSFQPWAVLPPPHY